MSRIEPRREGHPPDSPSDVRALPARPNLEFERKQAKKLLALLHKGDPEALARVHAKLRQSRQTKPDEFQLSDAQFTIAREYGFTSWPRLVEYFETLARHEVSGAREGRRRQSLESWARTIVAEHKERRPWTADFLGAYVPRFFARGSDQILAAEVTDEDARLATARMYRYPSWDVMISEVGPHDAWTDSDTPVVRAARALQADDLVAVEKLVAAHPELLQSDAGRRGYSSLAYDVILREVKEPTPATRRAYDWLTSRVDARPTLNWMVLGHFHMKTVEMQRLLDLGADPEWTPPNGFSVLEHVIYRSWNGEIVDLIASRVTPREGFWISAGLGDAEAVKRYVSVNGIPTAEARQVRPDFTAIGIMPLPSNPNADDLAVVWEAFLVAALNQRFAVLDVLLDRGFPIDYMPWGQPVLHLAVGNGWLPLAEYLVRRGANVDLKGWRPHLSARELAEESAMNPHGKPDALRILELCGGRDLATLHREREERRAKRVMPTAARVEDAFEYARQDAASRGLAAVDQESLFIGILREAELTVEILANAGVDLQRLRLPIRDRLDAVMVDAPAEMTANPEVSSILMDARTVAEQRKHEVLTPLHIMHALMQRASRAVLKLIEEAGGSKEKVVAGIERALADMG